MDGAEILSGFIRHGGDGYEAGVGSDDYDEEAHEEEEDTEHDEGEEVLIDADTGVTTMKKRKKPTADTFHPRWKALEDECLIDVLMVVSFCPNRRQSNLRQVLQAPP
jgi:hypothetical protein